LGNNIETLTADRDALTKENESLKAELKPRKKNRRAKKTSVRKHGGN